MSQAQGKNLTDEGGGRLRVERPHKAVSFVVERDKEIQEWNEQKLPKVLLGYSEGRLPGISTKEEGREEKEEEEDSRERRIRKEIAQTVIECIKEKATFCEDAKSIAHTTSRQIVRQSWDCSQIENEEVEEEEGRQKENQMDVQ